MSSFNPTTRFTFRNGWSISSYAEQGFRTLLARLDHDLDRDAASSLQGTLSPALVDPAAHHLSRTLCWGLDDLPGAQRVSFGEQNDGGRQAQPGPERGLQRGQQ